MHGGGIAFDALATNPKSRLACSPAPPEPKQWTFRCQYSIQGAHQGACCTAPGTPDRLAKS